MRLKQDFIVHKTGEESILVPTGNADFSGVVKGNQTLGFILDCLKEDTTAESILEKMTVSFEGDRNRMEADVKKVLGELQKIGAIEE